MLPGEGETTSAELYLFASDVKRALERVRDAGGAELSPLSRRGWGDEVAYFRDPEGNVLALVLAAEALARARMRLSHGENL